jgi:tetratricopeptide (TPR) repeat protein
VAALSLSRLDFADEADRYYRLASHLDYDDLHHRAFGLVRANHRERAIQAYQKLLSLRPDDVLALRRQAAVLISQMRRHEAMKLAERLTRIPSGAVVGHTLLGLLNHELGEPELAVAAFERVLALDADLRAMPLSPAQFWIDFGNDLIMLGRYDDARRYLSRALARDENAMVMALLGDAYYRDSRLDEAEARWQQAIQWDPKLPIAWLNLGQLALTRGRVQEAIPLLERAARLSPAAYKPLYSLSLAHARLGRNEEADRYRRQAERNRSHSSPPREAVGSPPSPPS